MNRLRIVLLGMICLQTFAYGQAIVKADLSKTNKTRFKDSLSIRNLIDSVSAHHEENPENAIYLLNLAKQQSIEEKDTTTLIKALTGIGRVYSDRGENPTALSFYQTALFLAEKKGDQLSVAFIEKNVGILYISWKNLDKALQHYEIAQQIALKLGNNKLIADCYNNKGTVYEQQEQYPKALYAYGKALSFYQKNKSLPNIAMSYSNMAIVHKQQKQYQRAIDYNFKALDIMQEMGEKWMQAATLNNIGSVYYSMKNYESTLIYCEKSLQIARSIRAKEIEVAAYETLADAAAALKRYNLAYNYMLAFHKVNEDFINTEKTQQFSELEVKYKTEKKEQEIEILHKENIIQKLSITGRNRTIGIIIALFIFCGLFAALFYNRNQIKQNALIQEQNLVQRERLTKAIIDAEEKERQRIASDLHDGVGQLFTAVKLNLSGLLGRIIIQRDEDRFLAEKTMALVDESCKEVRVISHQMMPNMLLRSGIASDVKSFIEKIDSESLKVTVETNGFKNKLESNVETVLYRVIQETVNNVIKHAKATTLHIKLNRTEDGIKATITDNGVGFNTELKNDFDGIGLKNIDARINYLKGEVKYQSSLGNGTVVDIWVPLA